MVPRSVSRASCWTWAVAVETSARWSRTVCLESVIVDESFQWWIRVLPRKRSCLLLKQSLLLPSGVVKDLLDRIDMGQAGDHDVDLHGPVLVLAGAPADGLAGVP